MSKKNTDNREVIRCSRDNTITISKSGSIFENEYEFQFDEGKKMLVKVGKTNRYEIIQSHKDDTNIYKILERVMQGDYSLLDKNQGISLDHTKIPTSINEYNEYILAKEKLFNTLDPKVKRLFNNDYNNFIHHIEQGDIDKVLSTLNNKVINKEESEIEKESEVKSNADA